MKKCDRIISLVRKWNPIYLKKSHKFVIEVPTTVAEALELNKKILIIIGMMAYPVRLIMRELLLMSSLMDIMRPLETNF